MELFTLHFIVTLFLFVDCIIFNIISWYLFMHFVHTSNYFKCKPIQLYIFENFVTSLKMVKKIEN